MEINGPYRFQVKFSIIDPKTGTAGVVTCALSPAKVPDTEDLKRLEAETLNAISESGYRLMDRREFFDSLIEEKTGQRVQFSMLGSDGQWDGDVWTKAEPRADDRYTGNYADLDGEYD